MSKGDLTRQRIIAEAAPLFNQKGFAGCSMQDVMDATGLEKGGLYRHFSSKEELAAEAFRYSLERAVDARMDGVDKVRGAPARLAYIVRRFVETVSPVPGGCPVLNTAVDSDDGNPVLRKLVRRALADWKAGIVAVIREGVESGEIRRDVDAERLASTIIAALEGGIMLSRIEGSRDSLRNVEVSLSLLIDAVTAPVRNQPPTERE